MEISGGYYIRIKNSDEKGMLDTDSMIEFTKKAKNAVCEIKLLEGFGTGFFCKIPYIENDNLLLPTLITNDHVLSKELLNSKNDIEIIINGETKILSLNQRKIWNNKEMDFTCIEIKEKEDKIHTFFNLDDNVLDKNSDNDCYLNKNVIVYGINKNGKKFSFSNEIIKKNEDCFFSYTCNTFEGFSGGCIVNQSNNGVIGIHRGKFIIKNMKVLNEGIFIRNIIKKIKNSKASLLLKVNYNYKNFLEIKPLLCLLLYY